MTNSNKLQITVNKDISDFLSNNNRLFFNERDLQMHLAVYLKETSHYDNVEVEYFIPSDVLQGYEDIANEKKLYLDIVVSKDGVFVPIELKYKTKGASLKIARFGDPLEKHKNILTNQGAQDLGMYRFWKDIRRIELVRKRFTNVPGGVAVFVTNDNAYMNPPRSTSNNILFSMTEGCHSVQKQWSNVDCKLRDKFHGFDVEAKYDIHWETKKVEYGMDLYYCIVGV